MWITFLKQRFPSPLDAPQGSSVAAQWKFHNKLNILCYDMYPVMVPGIRAHIGHVIQCGNPYWIIIRQHSVAASDEVYSF